MVAAEQDGRLAVWRPEAEMLGKDRGMGCRRWPGLRNAVMAGSPAWSAAQLLPPCALWQCPVPVAAEPNPYFLVAGGV